MSAANASAKKRRTNPPPPPTNTFSSSSPYVSSSSTAVPPSSQPAQPMQPISIQQVLYIFDKRLNGVENKLKDIENWILDVQETDESSSSSEKKKEEPVSNPSLSNPASLASSSIISNTPPSVVQPSNNLLSFQAFNEKIETRIKEITEEFAVVKTNWEQFVDKKEFVKLQEMVLKLHDHFIDINRTVLQNIHLYVQSQKVPLPVPPPQVKESETPLPPKELQEENTPQVTNDAQQSMTSSESDVSSVLGVEAADPVSDVLNSETKRFVEEVPVPEHNLEKPETYVLNNNEPNAISEKVVIKVDELVIPPPPSSPTLPKEEVLRVSVEKVEEDSFSGGKVSETPENEDKKTQEGKKKGKKIIIPTVL